MVVVGGVGTILGPVVGAILLQIMPQALSFLQLPAAITGPMQGIMFTGLVLVFSFSLNLTAFSGKKPVQRPSEDAADDSLLVAGNHAAAANDDCSGDQRPTETVWRHRRR